MAVAEGAVPTGNAPDVTGAGAVALNASLAARSLSMSLQTNTAAIGPRGAYALRAIRETLRDVVESDSRAREDRRADVSHVLRAASGQAQALERASMVGTDSGENQSKLSETLGLFDGVILDEEGARVRTDRRDDARRLVGELKSIAVKAASEAATADRQRLVGQSAICF